MTKLKPYFIRKFLENGRISKFPKELRGYYCLVIPLKIKTKKERDNIRTKCRDTTEYCKFSFLGKSCHIYTDGFTAQLKPMIPSIKEKVFQDCIKNPRKYLGETKK